MRLICPNCGAQYEVDESVIPDAGRDVQCANCGHTWFQRPPHVDRELAEEMGHSFPENVDIGDGLTSDSGDPVPPPPPRQPDPRPTANPAPDQAEAATAPQAGPEAADANDDDTDAEVANALAGGAQPERKRRTLDPEFAGLLREEAEREKAARAAERRRGDSTLESQPDLGLDARPTEAPRVAPTRAHVRKVQTTDRPDTAQDATPRREETGASRAAVLPNVDEINSTLRPGSDRGADRPDMTAAAPVAKSKGGFRAGFLMMILLAAAGAAAYLFAPQIAEAVPDTAGPLEGYVAWVNDTRVTVDAALQDGLVQAQQMLSDVMNGDDAGSEPVE